MKAILKERNNGDSRGETESGNHGNGFAKRVSPFLNDFSHKPFVTIFDIRLLTFVFHVPREFVFSHVNLDLRSQALRQVPVFLYTAALGFT